MPWKHWSEAAGIWKVEMIVRSIVAPCFVKKVCVCANTMPYTKHVAHMGISPRTVFASSTSMGLQTGLPCFVSFDDIVAALLRNLIGLEGRESVY